MKSLTAKHVTCATLLLGSLILSGCGIARSIGSVLTDLGTPKTALTQISMVTTDNANGTSSTAVDIVFVYNDKVNGILPTKNSTEWFKKRDELLANLRQQIEITAVEIPPAFVLERVPLPKRHSHAVKVVAFANYLDKRGLVPIDLTNFVHPLLTLEAGAIQFTELHKNN